MPRYNNLPNRALSAYMPFIPYQQVHLNGVYEPVPFEVPFSSQAAPGQKYELAEISVPAQVTAVPAANTSPANPTAAQGMAGTFSQSTWTVGPYGMGDATAADDGSSTSTMLLIGALVALAWAGGDLRALSFGKKRSRR